MSTYGKIDDKLNRKVLAEKSMEKKLIVGHKLLKESATFLKDKKYKFNCFFDWFSYLFTTFGKNQKLMLS